MKIILLGLEFANPNLGCQALAYSFAEIAEKAVKNNGIDCEYESVVFYQFDPIRMNDSDSRITSKKINYKSLGFWRSLKKDFKNSDLIVDFTGGDSFSDIYGNKRFRLATLVKFFAVKSKTPLLLGPQTYGPFKSKLNRKFAAYIIKKAKWVFARDLTSAKYAKEISGRDVDVSIDVAFSLPYKKAELEQTDKIRIGINVSGFLWEGGYANIDNPVKVEYQKYCLKLLEYFKSSGKYQVYLIPHVGTISAEGIENDLAASLALNKQYPETIVVKDIRTPMDAKNFISAMDLFIGARMHATIAALSTGVATIPFSYSRKFEGLFGYLDYPYVVSGTTEETEAAIEKTIRWIEDKNELVLSAEKAQEKIQIKKNEFLKIISKILCKINKDK